MNKIWVVVVITCLTYGIITGSTNEMVSGLLNVPKDTFDILISMGGLIIFYNGLLQIAIDSGLIAFISKRFDKVISFLFPKLSKESESRTYISSSLIANLLGLGAAATPMFLKALETMKKENNNSDVATHDMVKLVLLNITSFTILPVTVLSIRKMYFSKINIELIPYLILSSFILTVLALTIFKSVGNKNG